MASGAYRSTSRCSSLNIDIISCLQEELEIPYEIVHYKRQEDGVAPVELKAVHPIGTAPIITDGSVTVAESGAIIGEHNYHRTLGSEAEETRVSHRKIRKWQLRTLRVWPSRQSLLCVFDFAYARPCASLAQCS